MTDWQVIFINSVANGGEYRGDYLSIQPWRWPSETWLAQRLEQVRKEQADDNG